MASSRGKSESRGRQQRQDLAGSGDKRKGAREWERVECSTSDEETGDKTGRLNSMEETLVNQN